MISSSTSTDYSAVARAYAEAVGAGTIVAGKLTRLATQRFLDDLSRANTPAFPYRFDDIQATKFCAFVERCCHIEGPLGGQRIHLEPWQVWMIANVYGWICASGPRAGLRRFRKAYIEVARGNGKSAVISALALAMLAIDNDPGAQVYAAATKQDQARVIWDTSAAMVHMPKTAPLMKKLGVDTNSVAITVKSTNSRYKPLSSEHKKEDGKNISFCAIDELHAHETRGLWDVLVSGAGKRTNSLIWAITTAGYNLSGICYEIRTYIVQILEKIAIDESWFGCIWTLDDDDIWSDPACWGKANPNYGVSVDPSYFEDLARQAMALPSCQPEFLTKQLNKWLSSNQSWADIPSWQKCIDPTLDLADFAGRDVFIGVDLASKVDMAATVLLFPDEDGGFVAFPTFYLPQQAIDDGRNSQYRGWALQGLIKTTEGNVLDFAIIKQDILEYMETYNVLAMGIDPYEARQLNQELMAENVPVVEVRQSVMNLSEPTKQLDALTRSGKFHYNSPILLWMASNVIVRIDTNDNLKPNKAKPENKIDGIIATIIALSQAMVHQNEDHGVLIGFV